MTPGSKSDAMTLTVGQDTAITALASSVSPSVFGQSVTFTATVSVSSPGAGTPTGAVTFKDGSTTLGAGTLSTANGATTATIATGRSRSVRTRSPPSTAATRTTLAAPRSRSTQTVGQDSSAIAIGSSVSPSVFGQSVTFTATVSVSSPGAGFPTGTVMFKDETTTLGTGSLSTADGLTTATFSTALLSVSSHTITAVFGGDTNDAGSTSAARTQTVGQDTTTTTLATSVSPSLFGQSMTFTATVSVSVPGAGTPTGTVTFKDGTTTLGTGSLSTANGVTTAAFSTPLLSVGSHSITAVYGGDTNDASSTSAAKTQTVGQDSTTTRTRHFGVTVGVRSIGDVHRDRECLESGCRYSDRQRDVQGWQRDSRHWQPEHDQRRHNGDVIRRIAFRRAHTRSRRSMAATRTTQAARRP